MKKARISGVRQWLIFTIIILVVAGAGFAWFAHRSPVVESKDFIGKIDKIEGNTIFLSGAYRVDGVLDPSTSGMKVQAIIAPETKFTKIVIYLPTIDELKKTGGKYQAADLKRQEQNGNLADLQGLQDSIWVTASSNIYKLSTFTAAEVRYNSPVYPAAQKPGQ